MREQLLEARSRKITLNKDGRLMISIPRIAVEHTRLRAGGYYRMWILPDGGMRIEPVRR